MRILLVEPDAGVANAIELTLKTEMMVVYTTGLGDEAIDLAKSYEYDLIVTELNLPDMSGYEVIRKVRAEKIRTPIMVLSTMDSVEDKVRALSFGADDYLTKPFHRDELLARAHALVRRSKGHIKPTIEIGDMVVDIEQNVVTIHGEAVHFTVKEYRMIELMALRKGATITKAAFMDHLYGGMDEPDLKIVDVFICKLRRKITEVSGGPAYIETVWGRGYVLREPNAEDARYSKHPKRPPHLKEIPEEVAA